MQHVCLSSFFCISGNSTHHHPRRDDQKPVCCKYLRGLGWVVCHLLDVSVSTKFQNSKAQMFRFFRHYILHAVPRLTGLWVRVVGRSTYVPSVTCVVRQLNKASPRLGAVEKLST